jgi:hypothetical protein
MFHDAVDDPGSLAHDELYAEYEALVRAAVEGADAEAAAGTEVDPETVEALLAGESPDLTLEEGAALLALDEEAPDADTVVLLARDDLMMGMSNAVLDVEALSAAIDGEMEPREIQAKLEGRFPMTLREFARIKQYIGTRV